MWMRASLPLPLPLLLLALLFQGPTVTVAAAPPTTELSGLGKLVGTTMRGEGGVEVLAFLGVPYAAPPVGDRRWRPPAAARAWPGVQNASAFGGTCPGSQCGTVDAEDCLYLNVYTPDAARLTAGPWPVMVWIHGGAYDSGCSNQYAGDQLAARSAAQGQPVVVVTVNYRLNVFGFLGSEAMRAGDPAQSVGNYGIMDQRAALRFVRAHARAFNGDPARVTIFGESAGAGSVTNHLVQPQSFGLFLNAVAESGFAPQWGSKPMASAEDYFAKVLQLTGCADYACLRGADTAALMRAHANFTAVPADVHIAWAPVEDGVSLAADPESLLAAGKFASNVSILKGTNRDEYALFLPPRNVTYNTTHQQFVDAVTNFLPDTNTSAWLAELAALYSDAAYPHYPTANVFNATHDYWALVRSLTDQGFYCPGRRAGRNLVGDPSVRVFTYHLRQSLEYGGDLVPHTSEIPYVFNCSGPFSAPETKPSYCAFSSPPQADLAETTSGYWITFANTRTLPAPWEAIGCADPDTMLVLDVDAADGGGGMRVISDYAVPQCEFWDRVLAALGGDATARAFAPRKATRPRMC